jgi:hypothetical protein
VAAALVAGVTLLTVPAAQASATADVLTSSACGPIATTLVLTPRDGGVEASYELDQGRIGRAWRLALTRDGALFAHARRTTKAPGGALKWRVVAPSGGTITVTARRGSVRCTISGRVPTTDVGANATAPATAAPPASGGGGSSQIDVVSVSKCYTNATQHTGGEMLIKASSSDPSARLYAYRPDGSLIGEVQNGGGGRYGGSVMPYQSYDPGTVTISSSSGGSITVPTGPFQL